MASVSFRHVYKRFGDVSVVKDFNLEIADKEFLVFVGPSGCGKSTTLRMVAGLEEITDGDIFIGDRVVNDVPPKDRDIAMVFQNYALYPHMTVYDNMAFGLKLRKTPKDEIDRRVQEAADILGIENLLDRKPKQLSGGQRQRVAVGRAIVREPKVFLMDEPLSNLDAKLRVADARRDHQAAPAPGDHVHLRHPRPDRSHDHGRPHRRHEGRHHPAGRHARSNLYDLPANIFVAGFIGSPAMNFFDGTLVGEEGQLFVDTGDFRVRIPENRKEAFGPYVGKEVVMGIRPEHVHAPEYAPLNIDAEPVNAVVEVVELLGHELHLYLNSGKNSLVGTVDPRFGVHTGNKIQVVFDMDNVHLFDKATELAIR